MAEILGSSQKDPALVKFAEALITSLSEPVVIVNAKGEVLVANEAFRAGILFSEENSGASLQELFPDNLLFLKAAHELFHKGKTFESFQVTVKNEQTAQNFLVNARSVKVPGGESQFFVFSFKADFQQPATLNYKKLLNEILAETPALVCTLRGPEHIFELANEKYLQLFKPAKIIGKKVKDALPEVVHRNFLTQLDEVYATGKTCMGKEAPLKLPGRKTETLVDYLYEPLLDDKGAVEGIFVHVMDVTEKVITKRKLEKSKKELHRLIDSVPVIIWITNADGKGSFLNKNWYKFTGLSSKKSLSRSWFEAVHPLDKFDVENEFYKAHQEQRDFNVQYRLRTDSGEYRWVMDKGRPNFDENHLFQGLIGSVTDIHDDRTKELVIQEKEHLTRTIVEEATVATALYLGKEMRIEFANDVMIGMWGKDRSIIGKNFKEVLPEMEGQPFFGYLQEVYHSGVTHLGTEERAELFVDNKLKVGYFDYTYKPLRDQHGEIYGILHMANDVTENVNSKNWLKNREKHFRTMADLMPEKVVNTNALGEAVYFNRNWMEFTNMESEALKNRKWTNFIHPQDQDHFWNKWKYSLQTGKNFEMELRLRNAQDEYVWHLSRAEAVLDEQHQITMWIATNTDIQNLKEEEKRKEDFLKMVSHELKTPVTSIKGYIQMLLGMLNTQKPLEDLPIKPSLERVNNQIVRLTRLITDILDISRLEDDKLELKQEIFNINTLVEETVQDIQLTNTQHTIKIIQDKSFNIFADKDRIGQVLINFVTNAIKYSPESKEIEVAVLEYPNDQVGISVRDSGIGIDPKEYQNIFKRFYRIGVESEETYSGFGLGLYLANEIIERHNGYIEVSNNKDKGSNFTFILSTVS